MDISELNIEEGNNFTTRQLKTRLSLMGFKIPEESIPKSELVKIYDEALKRKDNKMKILKDLINDTYSKNKNIKEEISRRIDPIEIEVSREPKLSSNPSIFNLRLTGRSNVENKFNDLIPIDIFQSNLNQKFSNEVLQDKNPQMKRRISIKGESYVNSDKDSRANNIDLTYEDKILNKNTNKISSDLNQEHLNSLKTNANINKLILPKENLNSQQNDNPNYINLDNEKNNNFQISEKNSKKENNHNFEFSNKNILNNIPPNFEGEINKLDQLLPKDKRRSEFQKIPKFQDLINVQFDNDNSNNNFIPQLINKAENLNTSFMSEIKNNNNIVNQNIYSVHHFGDSIFSLKQNEINKPFKENKHNSIENKSIYESNLKTIQDIPNNFSLADSNNIQKNYNILQTIKEVDSEANSKSINKNLKKSNQESGDVLNKNITDVPQNFHEKEINLYCNFNSFNAKLKDYDSINNRLPKINNGFNSDFNSMDSQNSKNNLIPNSVVSKTNIECPIPENDLTGGKIKFINCDKESAIMVNYPSFCDLNKQASQKITSNVFRDLDKVNFFSSTYSNINNLEDSNKLKLINNDKNIIQISNGNHKSENSKLVPTYTSETFQPILNNQGKNKNFVNEKNEKEKKKTINFRNFKNQTEENTNFINIPTNFTQSRNSTIQINSNEKEENSSKIKINDEKNNSFINSKKQIQNNHMFNDHQKIIFGVVGLGFIAVSLAGLNYAKVDVEDFKTKSLQLINNITVGNFIELFENLINITLKFIQRIFTYILSNLGASIWSNIYLIVFLIIIVLIIRYIYMKIHYRKISRDIFKIIKNRLREIKRKNSNNFRAGIRVEEMVDEFSELYKIDNNNFRENILPLMRIMRNKDEDIRCFGENEGGKYFEKWQFKGF